MRLVYIEHVKKGEVFPAKVTFDNGNSRIVHNEKDCLLLEQLLKLTPKK